MVTMFSTGVDEWILNFIIGYVSYYCFLGMCVYHYPKSLA